MNDLRQIVLQRLEHGREQGLGRRVDEEGWRGEGLDGARVAAVPKG